MDTFLSMLFEPIRQWLIQQGAWDTLVELWETISRFYETIADKLGIDVPEGGLVEVLLGALKLFWEILVILIKVIIEVINWIIGLFT